MKERKDLTEAELLWRERCAAVQRRRWAEYYKDPESPKALEYRAKMSAVQLKRHARYNMLMAMLDRMGQ